MKIGSYTCGKSTALAFDAAVARVTGELPKEEFGVLRCLNAAAEVNEELVDRRRAIESRLEGRIVQVTRSGAIAAAPDFPAR